MYFFLHNNLVVSHTLMVDFPQTYEFDDFKNTLKLPCRKNMERK